MKIEKLEMLQQYIRNKKQIKVGLCIIGICALLLCMIILALA